MRLLRRARNRYTKGFYVLGCEMRILHRAATAGSPGRPPISWVSIFLNPRRVQKHFPALKKGSGESPDIFQLRITVLPDPFFKNTFGQATMATQCYNENSIPQPTLFPCVETTSCCSAGDQCASNGFCMVAEGTGSGDLVPFYIKGCTSSDWTGCPKVCFMCKYFSCYRHMIVQ